jgi:hypothetical protein
MRALTHGDCAICKKQNSLIQLHDDNGGPWVCPVCAGKWHAEHGRRRKAGRVVVRAIQAYEAVGGKWNDLDKLKISALYGNRFFGNYDGLDPLGYMTDAVNATGEPTDVTSELLDAAVRLTHPDCHPPERHELAKNVTQELLALKPFAFPKPIPEPPASPPAPPRNDSVNPHRADFKEPLHATYPCSECKPTTPYFYCTTCKAEWDKRWKIKRDAACKMQREQYARRKKRRELRMPPRHCAACQTKLEGKRKDAKFCSNTCRQRGARGRASAGLVRETIRSALKDHDGSPATVLGAALDKFVGTPP